MSHDTDAVATDTRFAIGFACPWFGPIAETLDRDGRPCCPGCGAPLTVDDTPDRFWDKIRLDDLEKPGALAAVQWLDAELRTGRHFATFSGAMSAYRRETASQAGGRR